MVPFSSVVELNDLTEDLPRFESALLHFATRIGLDLSQFTADHLSVRCHHNETAERWRRGLAQCGVLISEQIIKSRPICLFELSVPLSVGSWHIECIELPYPGEKNYPYDGWEHVELVLGGDPATLYARAQNYLAKEVLLSPDITIKKSSPHGKGEQLPNPTLALTLDNITIKFHPYSLRDIVMSTHNDI